MQDQQAIDRYFTEQVVGRPFNVTLGRSVGVQTQPARGVLIEALSGAATLSALATRSMWAGDPAEVVMGQPVSLPGLARWRRGLLVALVAGWSALLVAATLAWSPR